MECWLAPMKVVKDKDPLDSLHIHILNLLGSTDMMTCWVFSTPPLRAKFCTSQDVTDAFRFVGELDGEIHKQHFTFTYSALQWRMERFDFYTEHSQTSRLVCLEYWKVQ
jgi:hypothetical protein